MTEKSPAFQFYPKDLLTDSEAMAMSNEALGMYFKLLCYDWINDGIPADHRVFMKMAGFEWTDLDGNARSTDTYEAIRWQINGKMMAHPSKVGFLTNRRLAKERQKQLDFAKKKSEAGKKGASNRWKQENGTAIVLPMANGMANDSSSSSILYSNSNSSKELRSFSSLLLKYKYMCDLFFEALRAWFPEAKGNTESKAWLDAFRLMVERDGYTEDQVVSLIHYVHGGEHKGKRYTPHHFWAKTILSPSGLRKHAQKLVAEIRSKKENPAPRPTSSKIVFTSENL